MANTITNVLPKLLAMGLRALRQNSIMPRLINSDYSELAANKGNVINIAIPSAVPARDVVPAVTFATNVDFSPGVAVVTLDTWKEAPFQMSDNDMLSIADGIIPMQASEAIKSLANAIDKLILGKATGFFAAVGTPGTTPFNTSLNVAAQAMRALTLGNAPLTDRRGVLDPFAQMNLMLNASVLNPFGSDAVAEAGIINGQLGTKFGIDWYVDQNVTTYTPGTGWVTGYTASTVSAAIGDTTLQITNTTASGTVLVGDIFSIGGGTQQYVVTVAATASATVPFAVKFYPALVSAVSVGIALTVIASTYTVNLAFHRDAIAFASRPLQGITGYGHEMASAVDPVSGVALRLEISRQYKQTTFSFDVLCGAGVVRPELGVKILG